MFLDLNAEGTHFSAKTVGAETQTPTMFRRFGVPSQAQQTYDQTENICARMLALMEAEDIIEATRHDPPTPS
jgi:hypothetical protein